MARPGIIESGKLSRIVLPLDSSAGADVQHRQDQPDLPQGGSPGQHPGRGAPAETAGRWRLPDLPWRSSPRCSREQHSGAREFINVIIGIGVVIGFAVVCLSMYMAVLQRTREIGILKSLGASQWFILRHDPGRGRGDRASAAPFSAS